MQKKNYYKRSIFAAVILLIIAAVILAIAPREMKWLSCIPVLLMLPIGLWRIYKENKQNQIPPSYNYRYHYEPRG